MEKLDTDGSQKLGTIEQEDADAQGGPIQGQTSPKQVDQDGKQLLDVEQPIRKSADGSTIDVDDSAVSHRDEEDQKSEKEDADADSDENENQIYYESDEIENNYMKQKQDQFQDIVHLRISVANQKENMFNIMEWMPKGNNSNDPKKKKMKQKLSEKQEEGGLEVIDEANKEDASLELSDGDDM